MQKHIVTGNVCDIYAGASSTSGVVSQALFGQTVEVREASGEFCLVHTQDRYSGWMRTSQLAPAQVSFAARKHRVLTLFATVHAKPTKRALVLMKLVLSTEVDVIGKPRRGFLPLSLPDGRTGWVLQSELSPVRKIARKRSAQAPRNAARHAFALLGTPYLWGGSSPFGIDCSGLVQLCYRLSGVSLLRDARLQINDSRFEKIEGATLETDSLEDGDLLFFGEPAADGSMKVTHVGMALSDGRMIHSAGGVGVVVEERRDHRYAGKFLSAARLRRQAPSALIA